jgi:cytochrome c5
VSDQSCNRAGKVEKLKLVAAALVLVAGAGCGRGFNVAGLDEATLSRSAAEAEILQGKALYDARCASCHGSSESSPKIGSSISQIGNAIDTQPAMASLRGTLSSNQIRVISLALSGEAPIAMCSSAPDVGKVLIHRLNRVEYTNTIRDLLGINYDAAQSVALPGDDFSGNFNNNAKVLGLTATHIAKYLEAAEGAMAAAFANATAKARLLPCDPAGSTCVQQALTSFLQRAFRRPATAGELKQYTDHFLAARKEGDSPELAIRHAMTAALVSSNFIYRAPAHPQPDNADLAVSPRTTNSLRACPILSGARCPTKHCSKPHARVN